MYHSESSYIENTSLHLVGNKSNEENIRFSSNLLNISTDLNRILLHYFLSSFKSNEFYNFYHDINIEMNEVYVCVKKLRKECNLLEMSIGQSLIIVIGYELVSYLLHYSSVRCVTFKELFVCKSNNKTGD